MVNFLAAVIFVEHLIMSTCYCHICKNVTGFCMYLQVLVVLPLSEQLFLIPALYVIYIAACSTEYLSWTWSFCFSAKSKRFSLT